MYVCMYDVVAAAVIIVIVLLLGGSSSRWCGVRGLGYGSVVLIDWSSVRNRFENPWVWVGGEANKKKEKEEKKQKKGTN